MKKLLAVIVGLSVVVLVAFQIPVEKRSNLESSIRNDFQNLPVSKTVIDNHVLDFDSESD